MKAIDGKELNTAKGGNIAREFNEFKDVLFNKKIIRHKMRIIQSKKNKLGTYEIDKISLSCFDDKRYVLDDGIHTLAYFHKDSVTNCKKIQKECEKIEMDCDKKDCEKIDIYIYIYIYIYYMVIMVTTNYTFSKIFRLCQYIYKTIYHNGCHLRLFIKKQ